MKIALIGYGKMGHMIEQVARRRGHEIVAVIDKDNTADFLSPAFRSAEVAIEFSTPATAEANIRAAWRAGLPVVSGTTGWDADALRCGLQAAAECSGCAPHTLMWSSNYSIGVNVFFALNKRLAGLLAAYPDYIPSVTEVHHIHKLDAPSGTAKTLAQDIASTRSALPHIESVREGEVPGIHTVTWDSPIDTISITHSAKSREGFALGAVFAAEWLADKNGWHTFNEVLGL